MAGAAKASRIIAAGIGSRLVRICEGNFLLNTDNWKLTTVRCREQDPVSFYDANSLRVCLSILCPPSNLLI
jgi:hypothetical protein